MDHPEGIEAAPLDSLNYNWLGNDDKIDKYFHNFFVCLRFL